MKKQKNYKPNTIGAACREFVFGINRDWMTSHRWVTIHEIVKPNGWVVIDHFDNPGKTFNRLTSEQEQYYKTQIESCNIELHDSIGVLISVGITEEILCKQLVNSPALVKQYLTKTFGLAAVTTTANEAEIMPQYAVQKFIQTLDANSPVVVVPLDNAAGMTVVKEKLENNKREQYISAYWKNNKPDKQAQETIALAFKKMLTQRFEDLFTRRNSEGELSPATIWGRPIEEEKTENLFELVR